MPVFDYDRFFGPDILAFTSDASVDFRTDNSPLDAEKKAWLRERGIPCDLLVYPKQVHGDVLWEADETSVTEAGVCEADAVVTSVPGLPIAVRTADCLPVLIADPGQKVAAAVHAGWKSARLSIASKTVEFLKRRWAVHPARLKVAFGPCIRKESCEVGGEFCSFFPEDVTEYGGKFHLDLAGSVRRQFLSVGVRADNIFDCGLDTFTGRNHFSFRRDGEKAGRMLSVIMILGGKGRFAGRPDR